MYKDTAGNAVTYEATNKPEETSKSGQKIVLFSDKTNDKIVLVVTTPSVLEMMHGRRVKIVRRWALKH